MKQLAKIFALVLLSATAQVSRLSALPDTRAEAEKDPVLRAMLAEMDRSRNDLVLTGFARPYFIEYRLEEIEDYQTKADFGAMLGDALRHQRLARVTVRVGNYTTDSSTARGDGAVELAALDNDPRAIRAAFWQATDQAYKQALAVFARKEAALKQVETPPQADDFSREKPLVSLAPRVQLPEGLGAWTQRVESASGLYRNDSAVSAHQLDVQYSTALFHARAVTTYLINSEGSILRKGEMTFDENFAAGTQAQDGMHLDRSYGSIGNKLADLDTKDAFEKHAETLLASLIELRAAPLVEEEYHGPVLVSADASADVMATLVAPAVVADRPDLGTEARTKGAYASSYHTRVLPEFMTVVDDPGLQSWEGRSLIGSYRVDDEGVAAQRVNLITDGRLENYLIGREPVRDFPQSNGHGRAPVTGPSQPVIGVLQVTASGGLSETAMDEKLLAMARERGLKDAYVVETMGPELTPRLLYRISAAGTRQLVRGAVLDDLDQRALRSGIVAAGNSLFVANYPLAVPQTVLAPALLFDDITIRRANEKNDKLPYYPPPE